jgi:hypothetical protein
VSVGWIVLDFFKYYNKMLSKCNTLLQNVHSLKFGSCRNVVNKLNKSWPILNKSLPVSIRLNKSWPNVTQLMRTPEEPKVENSNSKWCDIAGLLFFIHWVYFLFDRVLLVYIPDLEVTVLMRTSYKNE